MAESLRLHFDDEHNTRLGMEPLRDGGLLFIENDNRKAPHLTLLSDGTHLSVHSSDERYPKGHPKRNHHLVTFDLSVAEDPEFQQAVCGAFYRLLARRMDSPGDLYRRGIRALVSGPDLGIERGKRVHAKDLANAPERLPAPWEVSHSGSDPIIFFAYGKRGQVMGGVYRMSIQGQPLVVYVTLDELYRFQRELVRRFVVADRTDPDMLDWMYGVHPFVRAVRRAARRIRALF